MIYSERQYEDKCKDCESYTFLYYQINENIPGEYLCIECFHKLIRNIDKLNEDWKGCRK